MARAGHPSDRRSASAGSGTIPLIRGITDGVAVPVHLGLVCVAELICVGQLGWRRRQSVDRCCRHHSVTDEPDRPHRRETALAILVDLTLVLVA